MFPFHLKSILDLYIEMSLSRSSIVLPEPLRNVLELRNDKGLICPPSIEKKIEGIPFFKTRKTIPSSIHLSRTLPKPQTASSTASHSDNGNRFHGLVSSTAPDGWRNSASKPHTKEITDDDGFVTWSNKRRPHKESAVKHTYAPVSTYKSSIVSSTSDAATESPTAWKSARFRPLESKITSESMEDRIMGKVRGKINKIGESTYDATKAFMQQILDSGETEFLEEFMAFVFKKAATEPSFCGIYARLLHELADEFTHLRTEMQSRFREYTAIFREVETIPDEASGSAYESFIKTQECKKFRRGYSQFVTELAKHGEIEKDDFKTLIQQIVESIKSVHTLPDKVLLCEEYVDCLSKMCVAGASLLRKEKWMVECLSDLEKITTSPRSSSPGLSNKGLFAIMNILDFAKKDWKS